MTKAVLQQKWNSISRPNNTSNLRNTARLTGRPIIGETRIKPEVETHRGRCQSLSPSLHGHHQVSKSPPTYTRTDPSGREHHRKELTAVRNPKQTNRDPRSLSLHSNGVRNKFGADRTKQTRTTNLTSFKNFKDKKVLQWLRRKDKEAKRSNRENRNASDKYRIGQDTVLTKRQCRVELAKKEFDDWLQSKRMMGFHKKNLEIFSEERESSSSTTSYSQPFKKKTLFPHMHTSSISLIAKDLDSSHSHSTTVEQLKEACKPTEDVSSAFKADLHNSGNPNPVSTENTVERNSSSQSEPRQVLELLDNTLDAVQLQPEDIAGNFYNPITALNEKQSPTTDHVAVRSTYKQWQRQRFLKARSLEQARWATPGNFAMKYKSWREILKSGYTEAEKLIQLSRQQYYDDQQSLHHIKRTNEPVDSSKTFHLPNSNNLQMTVGRRRRILFRLPPTVLVPGADSLAELLDDAGDQENFNRYIKVVSGDHTSQCERLLSDAVVEKPDEWVETHICMNVE